MRRICPACNNLKDTDNGDFHVDRSRPGGFSYRCKNCRTQAARDSYAADPQKAINWQRAWRATDEGKRKQAERRDRLRIAAFDAYGNCCSCCGEFRRQFLTVEHVGGWGGEHRKKIGDGAAVIHQWLKKVGYPQDGTITLHCWNCNLAKSIHGYCPHEKEEPAT